MVKRVLSCQFCLFNCFKIGGSANSFNTPSLFALWSFFKKGLVPKNSLRFQMITGHPVFRVPIKNHEIIGKQYPRIIFTRNNSRPDQGNSGCDLGWPNQPDHDCEPSDKNGYQVGNFWANTRKRCIYLIPHHRAWGKCFLSDSLLRSIARPLGNSFSSSLCLCSNKCLPSGLDKRWYIDNSPFPREGHSGPDIFSRNPLCWINPGSSGYLFN